MFHDESSNYILYLQMAIYTQEINIVLNIIHSVFKRIAVHHFCVDYKISSFGITELVVPYMRNSKGPDEMAY